MLLFYLNSGNLIL